MMLDQLPDILTGRYVRLERLVEAHADGLLAIGRDPSIWRYQGFAPLRTREDARAFIRAAHAPRPGEGPQHAFAVVHLGAGRVAGSTRYLDIRPDHRGLEIGWTWYGREFQRTAVNTETKLLLLTHAFEVLGCGRVQFKTDHSNERSQRAIERLGAVLEGVFRNHRLRPDGAWRHSMYYSIIDAEWPAVRERLRERLGYPQ